MGNQFPEIVGSYKIQGEIGRGGMGAVFKAVHDTLERTVALKILPAEFTGNPEYVARFLREARTVATLRHEHIVEVYDAGEQDGRYYIAMEFIEGQNLGAYLKETGALSEEEGLRLLLQAAKGLAAAHEKGLVHRDIKPDNLLLNKDGSILRIVDFGLVRESVSNTQLTATGACLGTPQFMSPEQADGETADARTDLYSLGITFYRALTGKAPFDSTTVMNLLFKHKFEAPPDPKELNPKLSKPAANLILTMMAKAREDRPQSALELISLIERVQAGKKIPAPPVFNAPSISGTSVQNTSPDGRDLKQFILEKKVPILFGCVAGLVLLLIGFLLAGPRSPKAEAEEESVGKGKVAEVGVADHLVTTESSDRNMDLPSDNKSNSEPGEASKLPHVTEIPTPTEVKENPGIAAVQPTAAIDIQGELDSAKRFRQEKRYLDAADALEKATKKMKEGLRRTAMLAQVKDDRYLGYVGVGQAAEKKRDWPAAVRAYEQASTHKKSDLLSDKILVVKRKAGQVSTFDALLEVGGDSYGRGMRAIKASSLELGSLEMEKARAAYRKAVALEDIGVGMGARKGLKRTQEALAYLDAWKDEQAGHVQQALKAYQSLENSGVEDAELKALASTRRSALDRRRVTTKNVWPEVKKNVEANRIDEAWRLVIVALKQGNSDEELLALKAALKRFRFTRKTYGTVGLRSVLKEAIKATDASVDANILDGYARRLREELVAWDADCAERYRSVTSHFLRKDFDAVRKDAALAEDLIADVETKMRVASRKYDARSEEAGQDKKIGLRNVFSVKLKNTKNKAKAKRLKRTADVYRGLERRANALK